MKSFLLVAILVVISKADDIEDSKILSEAEPNLYAYVGLCTQDILNLKEVNFTSLGDIADTGKFDYVYSTVKFSCGSGEIHKTSKGYIATAIRHKNDNDRATTVAYTMQLTENGVIEETFVDKHNKIYTFKVIVIYFDKINGVLEYVKCSDDGTSDVDSRTIAVKAANSNGAGMNIAKELYDNDSSLKLNGILQQIKICKS